MLGRPSSACDGRLREKLPMTVPSLAAALKTWLAATTVPAPGMFCTMIDGRAGNVPAHVPRQHPAPEIIAVAGGGAGDDP